MKAFKTTSGNIEILEIEAVRVTKCFVYFIDGSRVPLIGCGNNYFTSWFDAREYLLTRTKRELTIARIRANTLDEKMKTLMFLDDPYEIEV